MSALLVSVRSAEEDAVRDCRRSGAIDVKEPGRRAGPG